jgi:hypothetical protein
LKGLGVAQGSLEAVDDGFKPALVGPMVMLDLCLASGGMKAGAALTRRGRSVQLIVFGHQL